MSQYTDSLLEAMGIISDDAVGKSTNASTITGTIEEIIDSATGKYKVKHLNQIIDVTSGGNMKYAVGDKVYILVPDNDMSEEKFIIGAASSALNGLTNGLAEDKRYKVSPNMINSSIADKEFSICSYENEVITIGDYDWYDRDLFRSYRELGYTTFLITMKVKNELKGRWDGTYGIKDSYDIFDFNTTKMTGSIYDLPNWTTQNYYVTLEDIVFGNLLFYAKGYEAQSGKPKDIHIKDLGLYAIKVIKKEDLPGTHLELVPSNGSVLQSAGDFTNLDPLLYIDGEECSLQYSDFYWFRKNPSVDTMHPKYVPIGGYGWECLNERDIEDNYILNKDSLRVSTVDVVDKSIYKCVINFRAYKNVAAEVITSEPITIKNEINKDFVFNIFAKNGIPSYHPTETVYLTASVSSRSPVRSSTKLKPGSSTFTWLRYDENGNIMDNRYYPYTIDPNFVSFDEDEIEERIFFPANNINTKNTIVCGYYIDGSLASIAEITILAKSESGYQLVITNGDVVYKYDVDGDSPYSFKANDLSKLQIKPLGFQIFKEDGTEFSEEEYGRCEVSWETPANRGEESLIKSVLDWDPTKRTYAYTLEPRYDKVKANNNIINLEVYVHNFGTSVTLKDSVTIKCIKEGENGTNGTRYVAFPTFNGVAYNETVSEKGESTPARLTFLYEKSSKPSVYYRVNDRAKWNNFYQNSHRLGVNVYDVETGQRLTSSEYKVAWKIVENKGVTYTSKDLPNPSPVKIDNNGILSYDTSITELGPAIAQADVTILKNNETSYDNTVIHCWYPFLLVKQEAPSVNHINKYFPIFNGAISSVMYESDGTEPSYATDGKEYDYDIELPYPLDYISDYFTVTKDYSSSFLIKDGKLIPENKFLSACNAQYASIKLSNANQQMLTAAKKNIQSIYNMNSDTQSRIDAAMSYLRRGTAYYNYGDWITTARTNDTESKKNISNDILDIAQCIANAYGACNSNIIQIFDILQKLSDISYYMDHNDMTRDEIIEYIYQIRNLLSRFYTVEIDDNGFVNITFNEERVRKYYFPEGDIDIDEINKEYEDAMTAMNGLLAISEAGSIEIMQSAIFYTNAYGFSELNNWDGTSVSVDEEKGLIVAPKVAAGYKNSDNSLTGVIMGVKCTNKGREAGLFGYKEGSQSFKISAEDGSVELGTSSCGQILIKPGTADNKWEATISTADYENPNMNSGSKINLTTGELDFGKGNLTWRAYGPASDQWVLKLGKGNIGDSNSLVLSPQGIYSNNTIAGAVGYHTWGITLGNKFGVTLNGDLYGSSLTLGTGDGKTVGNQTTAYFSTHGLSGTINGYTKQKEWGLTLGQYFGVTLDGSVYASKMILGDGTLGSDGSAYFSPSGLTGTIAGHYVPSTETNLANKWGITLGNNFGVTLGGNLYAKNAELHGNLYFTDKDGNDKQLKEQIAEIGVDIGNAITTANGYADSLASNYDPAGAAQGIKNYLDGTYTTTMTQAYQGYTNSQVGTVDTKVNNYLTMGGKTTLGADYMISPYIGGGYLAIVGNDYNVVIDPQNWSKSGLIFAIYDNHANDTVMGISNNALYMKGTIYANAGYIGTESKGWEIMPGQIRCKNDGTVTGMQTNKNDSLWVFFSGTNDEDANGNSRYGRCEFRVSKNGDVYGRTLNLSNNDDATAMLTYSDGLKISASNIYIDGYMSFNSNDIGDIGTISTSYISVANKVTASIVDADYLYADNFSPTSVSASGDISCNRLQIGSHGPYGMGSIAATSNGFISGKMVYDYIRGANYKSYIKDVIQEWVNEHS